MSEEIVNDEVVVEEVVPEVTETKEVTEEAVEGVVEEASSAEETAPEAEVVTPAHVVERLGRFDAEGAEEVRFSDGTTGFFKF